MGLFHRGLTGGGGLQLSGYYPGQREMVMPKGGGIYELRWEFTFISKRGLGMDRGGGGSTISGRLVAMKSKLVMKVGVEDERVHDFIHREYTAREESETKDKLLRQTPSND